MAARKCRNALQWGILATQHRQCQVQRSQDKPGTEKKIVQRDAKFCKGTWSQVRSHCLQIPTATELSATVPKPMFSKPLLHTCWKTRKHRTHISSLSGDHLFSGCSRDIPPKTHVHWGLPGDIKASKPSALFQASFPSGLTYLDQSSVLFLYSHWAPSIWVIEFTHISECMQRKSPFLPNLPLLLAPARILSPTGPILWSCFLWSPHLGIWSGNSEVRVLKSLTSCSGDQQALQIFTDLAMPPPAPSLFVCSSASNRYKPPNNFLWNVCAHHILKAGKQVSALRHDLMYDSKGMLV